MLTTGLVSLNVHEALTFDGTEIVLHPDLFATDGLSTVNSIGTSTGRHTSNIRPTSSAGVSSSGSAVVGAVTGAGTIGQGTDASKDGSQSGTAAAAAASSSQQPSQPQPGAASLTATPSSEGGKLAWGATGGASIASQRRLEVGDMIEIRVWDPAPLRERHQSPGGVSSVFRKRSGASVQSNQSSVGSVSTEAQKSHTTASKKGSNNLTPSALTAGQQGPVATTTRNTLDSVTSNLSRKMSLTTQSSSAHSMQYSEFSASERTMQSEFLPPTSSKSLALTVSEETDNDSTVAESESVRDDGTSKSKESAVVPGSNIAAVTNSDDTLSSLPVSPGNPSKNIIAMPSGLASGGKPPVFARGRSNTTDVPRMPTANGLPKPPLQPRASTHGDGGSSTHGDMNFATYEAHKLSSKPTHTREISDMTTDSMVHGLLQNALPHQHSQHHHNNNQHASLANSNPVDFNVLGVDFVDHRGGDEDTEADDAFSIIGRTHVMRFSFAMLVTEKTLTSLKGSARTQVSMLRQVADLYKLSSYDMVSINRIEKGDEPAVLEAVSADFVLFSMKDQFISRGDMHTFQKALIGSWVYEGQRLTEVARVSALCCSASSKLTSGGYSDANRIGFLLLVGYQSTCVAHSARKPARKIWNRDRRHHDYLP